MNKLRVFEAFSGYGSQSIALKNIGLEHEVVAISEVDPDVIISYGAIRGDINQPVEMEDEKIREWLMQRNIGWDFQKGKSSIPRMKKDKLYKLYNSCVQHNNLGDISLVNPIQMPNMDLFTYSFPCFVEGTLIMTDNGFKKIEDIGCGDYVLTHTNTFNKVVKPMINKADHIYRVRNMSSTDLFVTEEHPFYVRDKKRVWNNARRSYDRVFSEPKWVKTKDLSKDTYLGLAINQKSELPNWQGAVFKWSDGRKDRTSNILNQFFDKEDFWWVIGRYMGDGWIRHQGGIIICCDFSETEEITDKLNSLCMNYCVSKSRTTNNIHIAFKEIGEYCEQFGRGAVNKRLTGDILNLPVNLLKGFLDGYMSADGCFTQGLNKATSVSQELIHGIGQCVAKVYKRPFSIGSCKRKETCVIEGRVVNQKTTYSISWKNEKAVQDKAFYEDGYIWCPITQIEKLDYDGFVYNMEVENDNSYTANGIIVHNCTDISVAGHQQGLAKDSGTRSGLLWECEKVIKAKKPRFLLMENVKNLVSKKFKPDFDVWCEWLEEQGYTNYWQVLNAKDYGIPQNRERVFMISILGEHEEYDFPSGFDNGIRLKHVLESEVDSKYYISQDKVERLLTNIQGKIDLSKGIVGTCHERNDLAFATRDRVYNAEFNSPTICATDYKDSKKILCIGNVNPSGNGQNGSVYSAELNSPTITVNKGEGPKVAIPCLTPDRVEKRQNGRRFKTDGEPMFTLTSQDRHGVLQVENQGVVIDDTYSSRPPRVYTEYSPTLRSEREGLKTIDTEVGSNSPVRIGNIYGEDKGTGFAGNVWSKDAISPTLTTMQGGNRQPMTLIDLDKTNKVIKVDAQQEVVVRKYAVDTDELKVLLRKGKESVGLTNKEIAEALQQPLTLVEHWFRNDNCFAIPGADIWFELKALLKIDTNAFDESITTFIEKDGVYEKANRLYFEEGISPTLTCTTNENIITSENKYHIRKLTPKECWRLMGMTDEDFEKCVAAGISNSQLYKQAGNSIVVNVLEYIFASLFKVNFPNTQEQVRTLV